MEDRTLKRATRTSLVAGLVLSLCAPSVQAQSVLATVFKKYYKAKSVACESCHIKSENKDEHVLNDLGKVLAKFVDGKEINRRLEAIKDREDEEAEKVKEAVSKDFEEALKKLDELKAPSGKLYPEAIKAGEVEGTKPRK
jgi:hypothetical protein